MKKTVEEIKWDLMAGKTIREVLNPDLTLDEVIEVIKFHYRTFIDVKVLGDDYIPEDVQNQIKNVRKRIKHPSSKLVWCRERNIVWGSIGECGRFFGVKPKTLSGIIKSKKTSLRYV